MTDEFTGPEPGTETERYQRPIDGPDSARPIFKPTDEATGLSSVEINTTAKGDIQVRVKVYAETNSPQAVQQAADNAADLYRSVRAKVNRRLPEADA